jgi:hypothetical protein
VIALLAAISTTIAYWWISLAFARRAYRHEYDLIYGSPAPMLYGGKHGHEKAHEVAIKEALWAMAFWPLFLAWDGIDWLVTHGTGKSWVERDNEMSQLQHEVDQLAVKQDPLAGLDHEQDGVRVTNRQDLPQWDPWLWQNPVGEIIYTSHPELIKPVNTGRLWRWDDLPEMVRLVRPSNLQPVDALPHNDLLAEENDCLCPTCRPETYLWRSI